MTVTTSNKEQKKDNNLLMKIVDNDSALLFALPMNGSATTKRCASFMTRSKTMLTVVVSLQLASLQLHLHTVGVTVMASQWIQLNQIRTPFRRPSPGWIMPSRMVKGPSYLLEVRGGGSGDTSVTTTSSNAKASNKKKKKGKSKTKKSKIQKSDDSGSTSDGGKKKSKSSSSSSHTTTKVKSDSSDLDSTAATKKAIDEAMQAKNAAQAMGDAIR
jgi:hypothetical protein